MVSLYKEVYNMVRGIFHIWTNSTVIRYVTVSFSQFGHHTLSPSTHSHSTVCPIPCSVILCSVTFNVQSFCVQSHSILSHSTFSRAALDHSTFNICTFSEGIHRPKMNITPLHGKMSSLSSFGSLFLTLNM